MVEMIVFDEPFLMAAKITKFGHRVE